jgi:halimadienyl-diphosphate synthase
LDALRVFPECGHQPRMVEKILGFLRRTRLHGAYWFDKWHISPYYVTSHAAITAIGFDNELARGAINWILDTRRGDGSWGHCCSTSEETAYCLQALIAYHRQVEPVDQAVLSRAAQYLYEHYESQDYPALWLDKCLYIPLQIVRSTILSALRMYEVLSMEEYCS